MKAHQAPPSMGFSGQEYWSGLPVDCLFLSCLFMMSSLHPSCINLLLSLSLSLCVFLSLSHTHKHAEWLAIFSAHKKTILRVYEASLEAVVGSRMNNRTSALRKGIRWKNKLSSCQCSFPGGCLRIPGQC